MNPHGVFTPSDFHTTMAYATRKSGLWSGLSLDRGPKALGLSHQVSTPSWKKPRLARDCRHLLCAAVSPTSTEFTRAVSLPGAQNLKSDASADSATPASEGNLYVIVVRIKHSTELGR